MYGFWSSIYPSARGFGHRSCDRATGPMVDRHVVREARPLQAVRHDASRLRERLADEAAGVIEGREGPEAVDDAEPEAVTEEPAAAPAPVRVFGSVAEDPRDV